MSTRLVRICRPVEIATRAIVFQPWLWQDERETTTFTEGRGQFEPSPMGLRQLPGDGQTQAASFTAALFRPHHPFERLEDACLVGWIDADTRRRSPA